MKTETFQVYATNNPSLRLFSLITITSLWLYKPTTWDIVHSYSLVKNDKNFLPQDFVINSTFIKGRNIARAMNSWLTYCKAILSRVCKGSINYIFEIDDLWSSSNSIASYYHLWFAIHYPLGKWFSREPSKNNLNIEEASYCTFPRFVKNNEVVNYRRKITDTIKKKFSVQYRVNSTNASTSKHSYWQLHKHW